MKRKTVTVQPYGIKLLIIYSSLDDYNEYIERRLSSQFRVVSGDGGVTFSYRRANAPMEYVCWINKDNCNIMDSIIHEAFHVVHCMRQDVYGGDDITAVTSENTEDWAYMLTHVVELIQTNIERWKKTDGEGVKKGVLIIENP